MRTNADHQRLDGLEAVIISGGPGDEVIIGTDGPDVLSGGGGQDGIEGRGGDDIITGGGDADGLAGGAGADTFVYTVATDSNASGYDNLYDFETGVDRIDLTAISPTNLGIVRSGGSSYLFAATAAGAFQLISAGRSINGSDLVYVGTAGITMDGDASINVMTGGSRADRMFGMDGDDVLFGGDGADLIDGGTGQDGVEGGAGDDTIIGGAGADGLAGGAGADVFVYRAATDSNAAGYDNLYDFETGSDRIDFSAVGRSAQISIVRQGGSSYLFGDSASGAFQLIAAGRAINASDLNFAGPVGVYMVGDIGADVLVGSTKVDAIDGGAGDDVIIGGGGPDTLVGGAGADTFRYVAYTDSDGSGIDFIRDYQRGVDLIDVSSLALNSVLVSTGNAATILTMTGANAAAYLSVRLDTSFQQLATRTAGFNLSDIQSAGGAPLDYVVSLGDSRSSVTGTASADTIRVAASGPQGGGTIIGGGGSDTITLQGSLITVAYLAANDSTVAAPDLIRGFVGYQAYVAPNPNRDYIDLTALTLTGGLTMTQSGSGTLLSAETTQGIINIRFDTFFVGGADLLFDENVGLTITGNDSLALLLTGTANADTITNVRGGYIHGGGGADILIGGTGSDNFAYTAASDSRAGSQDMIRSFTTGRDLISFGESLSSLSVTRTGTDSIVSATGLSGAYSILVQGSDVNLRDFTGQANVANGINRVITGSAAADTLIGSNSTDTLRGEGGDDILIGGGAADAIYLGGGNNIVRYLSSTDSGVGTGQSDIIFEFGPGRDKIDLSAVRVGASDRFTITYSGIDAFVNVFLNGHTDADMIIRVLTAPTLSANDVIFNPSAAPMENSLDAGFEKDSGFYDGIGDADSMITLDVDQALFQVGADHSWWF